MTQLLRFPSSVKRDPAIETWMKEHAGELGVIAKHWFEVMRKCGEDVRELLHDGHPTACVADAAFAYVNVFKAQVNVGFFRGAKIADPKGLLEGTGKFMRHVKLRPESAFDATVLMQLIDTAYTDMRERVQAELLRAGSYYPSNEKGPHRAAANPAIALRLQSLRPVRRAADLYWVVRCARNEGTYELRSE